MIKEFGGDLFSAPGACDSARKDQERPSVRGVRGWLQGNEPISRFLIHLGHRCASTKGTWEGGVISPPETMLEPSHASPRGKERRVGAPDGQESTPTSPSSRLTEDKHGVLEKAERRFLLW